MRNGMAYSIMIAVPLIASSIATTGEKVPLFLLTRSSAAGGVPRILGNCFRKAALCREACPQSQTAQRQAQIRKVF